jgi:Arc/MetJ-type ribon-helix-helix transcriptional regulator
MMARSKRILFTFDPASLSTLAEIREYGPFPSMSDAVRDAIRIVRALQAQARQGYTEFVVRDPRTKQERVIVLPEVCVTSPAELGSDSEKGDADEHETISLPGTNNS